MSKKLFSVLLSVLMVIMSMTCLMTMPMTASATTSAQTLVDDDFQNSTTPSSLAGIMDVAVGKQDPDGWYRATGGHSFNSSKDYAADKTTDVTNSKNTIPTYFAINSSVVNDPTGTANNQALRIIQNAWRLLDRSAVQKDSLYKIEFKLMTVGLDSTPMRVSIVEILQNQEDSSGAKFLNYTNRLFDVKNADIFINGAVASSSQAYVSAGQIYFKEGDYCNRKFATVSVTFNLKDSTDNQANNTDKFHSDVAAVNFHSDVANAAVEGAGDTNAKSQRAFYIDDVKLQKLDDVEDGTFEGKLLNEDLTVKDVRTWPNAFEFAASANEGYYRGIDYANKYYYDNVNEPRIVTDAYLTNKTSDRTHEIDGWKYVDENGNPKVDAVTSTSAKVVSGGHNSDKAVEINTAWHAMWTKIKLPRQHKKYKVTMWIKNKTVNMANVNVDIAVTTTANVDNVNNSIAPDKDNNLASWVLDTFHINKNSTFSANEWTKVEFEFNSGVLSEAYIAFSGNVQGGIYYLDDIAVEEVFEGSEVAFVDKNKAVIANCNAAATVKYNGTVGTVSGLSSDAKFLGWFADVNDLTTALETDDTYNCKNGGVPVVMVDNILDSVAGSYEGYEAGTNLETTEVVAAENAVTYLPKNGKWGENSNSGYYRDLDADKPTPTFDGSKVTIKQSYNHTTEKGGGMTITVADLGKDAYSGSKALKISGGSWVASMAIDVEPHTNYQLSFQFENKGNATCMAITSSLNVSRLADAAQGNVAYNALAVCAYDTTKNDAQNWTKRVMNFYSADLTTVYLTFSAGGISNVETYVDDLTLVKADTSALDEDVSNSIRTTDMALRYKLNVDGILNNTDSYLGGTVTEIGFIAVRKARLNSADLVTKVGKTLTFNGGGDGGNNPTVDGDKIIIASGKGWTQDGSNNKVFSESTGNCLRAALYNIGATTSGNNYKYLAEDYSVRLYVKLDVGGVEQYVYGTVANASVMTYCEYVLDNEDIVAAADYNAVINFLADKTTDKNGKTKQEIYDAYLASK